MLLLSNLTKDNMIERRDGYEEHSPSDAWHTVEYLTDDGDKAQAKQNIEQALKKYPNLAGIVGMNGYHGPLLRKILGEAGALGRNPTGGV